MQKTENYPKLLAALFTQNPDRYNKAVLALLLKLRTRLLPQEFEAVLKATQNRLRTIKLNLEYEFDYLLMEYGIEEGLREYRTMSVKGAAYELILLGVKFPKQKNGLPSQSDDKFWSWFFELPEVTRQTVWDKAGYPMYPRQ